MTSHRFGQSLREARQLRGLTVEQLAQETSIPVSHIEALEMGAVNQLPRAMYRRAEARAYAEAVGLDPDVILTALRRVTEHPHPESDAVPTQQQRHDHDEGSREPGSTPDATPPAPDGTQTTATKPFAQPIAVVRPPAAMPVAVVNRVSAMPARSPASDIARGLVPRATNTRARVVRALLVLLIGCGGLVWEQTTPPRADMTLASPVPVTLPALRPATVIDEAVRIAEPPQPPPSLRRAFYEPRIAANGRRWPSDGRLDEGVLVVHSTPRGARVTVNGVGWGLTPVAIRYLPLGTLRVRVGKEDYAAQERVVNLTAEKPNSVLRLSLHSLTRRKTPSAVTPAADMLVITTSPAGARVTVNGIGWGTSPVTIPHLEPGTQRVRVVKDQFHSEERVVQVSETRPGRVAITLKPTS